MRAEDCALSLSMTRQAAEGTSVYSCYDNDNRNLFHGYFATLNATKNE